MKSHPPETKENMPRHVAVIMDGNGRWAAQRGLPRTAGHKKGSEAAKEIVRAASDLGIQYLTLFGFSSENWNRPVGEISDLMQLLRFYLRSETAEMHKNNIRMRVIGDRAAFDPDIIEMIENAENLTKGNTGLTVIMALNYGGRHDIVQAARKLVEEGVKPEEVQTRFEEKLMTAGIPDPDVLIRTSGEQRISNFLLWQCAYAELVFSPALWPDFGREELKRALAEYAGRERRFGALKTQEG
jgi:undecaprenyl diphosphate synthase